jgi:hypothetical protein
MGAGQQGRPRRRRARACETKPILTEPVLVWLSGVRLCETNPICRPRPDGTAAGTCCTNKANLLRAPSNGRGAARSPLPAPDASVRNEANSCRSWTGMRAKRSQFPSSARGVFKGTSRITPQGVTANAGPSTSNKANLGLRLGSRGPIVQNEPNFGESASRTQRPVAQTGQFPRVRPRRGIWDLPPRAGHTRRVPSAGLLVS